MEQALAQVIHQTDEISTRGINTSLLNFILQEVMKWIAEKMSE